jgi:hypothetical protein
MVPTINTDASFLFADKPNIDAVVRGIAGIKCRAMHFSCAATSELASKIFV